MRIDKGRDYILVIHFGLLFLDLASAASAGMKSLDDSELASVSGQSGITLEMDLGVTADKVTYYDDGKGIHLEGFRVGSASDPNGSAHHVVKVDIGADASLNLGYLVEDRRIEFGDIRLAGAPGLSMGGVFLDHSLEGYVNIKQGGATGGAGYTFDTAYTMTGGRLGYRTNGNEFFLDGITMDVEALGITLDVVGDTLKLGAPRIVGNWKVEAIRYSGNALNHGVSTDAGSGALLPSDGGISGEFDLSSNSDIRAGGREGEGLRSEEHTSELQSRPHLVCRLLLEKKKKNIKSRSYPKRSAFEILHHHLTVPRD